MSTDSPRTLRKQLREQRRSLSTAHRLSNESRISELLYRFPIIRRSRYIAGYLSEDGEVDLGLLQQELTKDGKKICLPVLRHGKHNRLWFSQHIPGDALYPNRFNILEPDTHRRPPIPLRHIDVILMPLVGFDREMNRLGMGGGFYDRSLALLRRNGQWKRPRLMGIAHECQRVESLDHNPWDVPLDWVVTEKGIFSKKGRLLA